jgi:hypothetical protein
MIARVKWIERTFAHDFPIGLMPQFVERLRGTPAQAEELCAGLSPAILTKRLDDKWSIQENIGHLIQVELIHTARIDDFLQRAATLRAADMSNRATEQTNYNEQPITAILQEFRRSRGAFIKRVEAVPDEALDHVAMHPRLGMPMRLVDMLYFVGEHDDFHLATAVELLRRQGGSI